jgi:hypothetical protein
VASRRSQHAPLTWPPTDLPAPHPPRSLVWVAGGNAAVTANNFERFADKSSNKWRDTLKVVGTIKAAREGKKRGGAQLPAALQSVGEYAQEHGLRLVQPNEDDAAASTTIPDDDDRVPMQGAGPAPGFERAWVAVRLPGYGFVVGHAWHTEEVRGGAALLRGPLPAMRMASAALSVCRHISAWHASSHEGKQCGCKRFLQLFVLSKLCMGGGTHDVRFLPALPHVRLNPCPGHHLPIVIATPPCSPLQGRRACVLLPNHHTRACHKGVLSLDGSSDWFLLEGKPMENPALLAKLAHPQQQARGLNLA